jgi:hypothetical protein
LFPPPTTPARHWGEAVTSSRPTTTGSSPRPQVSRMHCCRSAALPAAALQRREVAADATRGASFPSATDRARSGNGERDHVTRSSVAGYIARAGRGCRCRVAVTGGWVPVRGKTMEGGRRWANVPRYREELNGNTAQPLHGCSSTALSTSTSQPGHFNLSKIWTCGDVLLPNACFLISVPLVKKRTME